MTAEVKRFSDYALHRVYKVDPRTGEQIVEPEVQPDGPLPELAQKLDPDAPLFTTTEVLEIARMKSNQFQTWMHRQLLSVSADWKPGTGRRRLFSTMDVVTIVFVKLMTDLGVPVPSANFLAMDVGMRLMNLVNGGPGSDRENMLLILGKDDAGKWCSVSRYVDELDNGDLPDDVPPVFIVVEVDKLLRQTIEQLIPLARTSVAPTGHKGPRPDDEEGT